MKRRDPEEIMNGLVDGLAPPAPPPGLRGRVLTAARTGAAAEPAPDVWTRIWGNRWMRIIWATSVVALVIGHVAIIPPRSVPRSFTAEFQMDDGITEFLRAIRIEVSASPMLGRVAEAGHGLVETGTGGNER